MTREILQVCCGLAAQQPIRPSVLRINQVLPSSAYGGAHAAPKSVTWPATHDHAAWRACHLARHARTQLRRRTQRQIGSRVAQKMKIVSAPCTPSPQSARRLWVIQRTRRMASNGLARRRDWCRSRQCRLTSCVAMQQRKRADPCVDQNGVRVRTGVAAAANLALLGVSAIRRGDRPRP